MMLYTVLLMNKNIDLTTNILLKRHEKVISMSSKYGLSDFNFCDTLTGLWFHNF
jgi:hypothetical protein